LRNRIFGIDLDVLVLEFRASIDKVLKDRNVGEDSEIRGELLGLLMGYIRGKEITKDLTSGVETFLRDILGSSNVRINDLRRRAVDSMLLRSMVRFRSIIRSHWYRCSVDVRDKFIISSQLNNALNEVLESEIRDNWEYLTFGVEYPETLFTHGVYDLVESVFDKLESFVNRGAVDNRLLSMRDNGLKGDRIKAESVK